MIAIIDYDAGNVKSVQKALAYLHEDTILTRDPKQLLAAEKVILPGKHLRHLGRLTIGQRQVLVKELEGVGQCQEGADGDRRHYHGNGNTLQNLSFGGSIDLGCLDQFSRDILDTGNVDDHHITDLLPAHQNDQSPETKCGGIRQRTAEFHQDAV